VRYLLAMVIGVALALGLACGGDDDATSTNDGVATPTAVSDGGGSSGGATLQDACTLLADEQVNAALGDDQVAATDSEPPTDVESRCSWQGSNTGNRYVTLTLRSAQFAAQPFESNYRNADGAVAIPGVGDEAYALPGADTPNDYRFLTAAALTSSLYFQVDVAGPNRPADEAVSVLTTLMQQVVANLE
jgi:hypothetical protein